MATTTTTKEKIIKFKKGDRVKYVSDVYEDSSCNPLWGGKEGKIIGTITNVDISSICSVCVRWDNGQSNVYDEESLKHVFELGDRVKYVSGIHGDGSHNPLWGGKEGKIVGSIIDIDKPIGDNPQYYQVEWDTGIKNAYTEKDLELIKEEREFEIGDKVKFITEGKRIPEYEYRTIPEEKIIHGSCMLHEDYDKEFARIVDKYDKYYIVRFRSADDKFVRLGFEKNVLKLVSGSGEFENLYSKMSDTLRDWKKQR